MKQSEFDKEMLRDWERGVAVGLLQARQAEIDEHVAALVQEPMLEWERDGAAKGAARTSPTHTDRCQCGKQWPCSNQHVTKMDVRTGLPVWTDIPEDGTFVQHECLNCADPFRDMSSRLA